VPPQPPPPPPPPPLPPPPPKAAGTKDLRLRRAASQRAYEPSAWLVSFAVHVAALFLMGLITFNVQPGDGALKLSAQIARSNAPSGPGVETPPLVVEPNDDFGIGRNQPEPEAPPLDAGVERPPAPAAITSSTPRETAQPAAAGDAKQSNGKAAAAAAPRGGGWEGRDPDARAALAGTRGGNKQSELAVERGLRWLAAHQRADGSWCFDLKQPPCGGLCRNPGTEASVTAATGLALMPFLGAGYTHKQGPHQEVVERGLYALASRAVATPHGIDLRDGTMYGQAIATIALCEGYGMTRDPTLKDTAQGALRFIAHAQDLSGGGWRYTPGQPGDTTVTGWQLMALRSGLLARLEVPSLSFELANKFLDHVQFAGGARYGYQTPSPREQKQEATTAVGLLCRMYLGWDRRRPELYQGVGFLDRWGPSMTNLYYDYYATQVMHFWEGKEWDAWNAKMRDHLIATQAQESHEAGSWHFADPYGDRGGRLYSTAMAVMILEVYYRHMPLYGRPAVELRH
jgi:hypothetical protein